MLLFPVILFPEWLKDRKQHEDAGKTTGTQWAKMSLKATSTLVLTSTCRNMKESVKTFSTYRPHLRLNACAPPSPQTHMLKS